MAAAPMGRFCGSSHNGAGTLEPPTGGMICVPSGVSRRVAVFLLQRPRMSAREFDPDLPIGTIGRDVATDDHVDIPRLGHRHAGGARQRPGKSGAFEARLSSQ
jgi:hypothetical protein